MSMQLEWGAHRDSGIDQQRKSLMDAISGWVERDIDDITDKFFSGKGWERWAQNSLADYLQNCYENTKTTKEDHIYQGQIDKRADIGIIANEIPYMIELKCHRPGTQSFNGFVQGIDADWAKLTGLKIKPEFKNFIKFGIGMTFDETNAPGNWVKLALQQDVCVWYRTWPVDLE